jgi:hypothetical protein
MRETAMGFFDKYLKGTGDGAPVAEPAFETERPDAPELYVLPDPPVKTLTMREIAAGMFRRPAPAGSLEDYIRLNGGRHASVPPEIKKIDESEGRTRAAVVSEPGLYVPAVLWPAMGRVKAVAVLISENGKAGAAEEFAIERLRREGISCLALDPRGLGELKGLDLRLQTYLGQAPAFGMAGDIAAAIAALAPAGTKTAVVGRGPTASQAVLAAALLDPDIGFAAGLSGLREFADAFADDVPLIAVQPRANYAPPLSRLRGLVKAAAVWSFRNEPEPDWAGALIRWAQK